MSEAPWWKPSADAFGLQLGSDIVVEVSGFKFSVNGVLEDVVWLRDANTGFPCRPLALIVTKPSHTPMTIPWHAVQAINGEHDIGA